MTRTALSHRAPFAGVPAVILLVATCVLASAPVSCAAAEAARPGAARVLEHNFTLDDILRSEGEAVFLPYLEYDALRRAGEIAPVPAVVPFPWAFRSAGYDVVVSGESARVVATYELQVLDEGHHRVPVTGGPIAFEAARLDGQEVWLLPPPLDGSGQGMTSTTTSLRPESKPAAEAGCSALVTGAGRHELVVEFSVPVTTTAGIRGGRVGFSVPRSPISTFTVTLDAANLDVTVPGGLDLEVTRARSSTRARFSVPLGTDPVVEWTESLAAPPSPASPVPVAQARVEGETRSRYHFKEDSVTVDSEITFDVKQGRTAEHRFVIPNDTRVTRLREAGSARTPTYVQKDGDEGTQVTIKREVADAGPRTFLLTLEKSIAVQPPGPVAGPTPSPFAPSPAASASPTTTAPPAANASPATTAATAPARDPGPPIGPSVPPTMAATAAAAPATVNVDLPFARLLDVEQQSGFFSVASSSNLDVVITAPDCSQTELPGPGGARLPGRLAYGYSGVPGRVTASLTPLRVTPQTSCAIRAVRGRTVINPEGVAISTLEYEVANSGRPLLAVTLAAGAKVLGASLDGEPVEPGLRSAPAAEAPASPAAPPLFPSISRSEQASAAYDQTPEPVAAPAAPAAPTTGPAGLVVALPLKVNPTGVEKTARLELSYVQKFDRLGPVGSLGIDLPMTDLPDIAAVTWSVELPDGWFGSVSSNRLVNAQDAPEAGPPPEGEPASPGSPGGSGAPQPAPGPGPTLSLSLGPTAVRAPSAPADRPGVFAARPRQGLHASGPPGVRIDLPPEDPSRDRAHFSMRLPQSKPDDAIRIDLQFVSLGLKQGIQTALYVLTLLVLCGLLWLEFESQKLVLFPALLLLGGIIIASARGIPIAAHLGAAIVTVATLWLIRLVVGPAEERTPQ